MGGDGGIWPEIAGVSGMRDDDCSLDVCLWKERKKMEAWVALAYFQQLDKSFIKLLGDLTEEKMGSNGRTRLEIEGVLEGMLALDEFSWLLGGLQQPRLLEALADVGFSHVLWAIRFSQGDGLLGHVPKEHDLAWHDLSSGFLSFSSFFSFFKTQTPGLQLLCSSMAGEVLQILVLHVAFTSDTRMIALASQNLLDIIAQKIARKPYLTRPIWWTDEGERKVGSSVKNCPAPPVSGRIPAAIAADRGGEGLRLEEGSLVVHLALVVPESGVGVEIIQLPKSAAPPLPNPEISGFIKSELRNIYGYATELLLIVTSSLQLQFESTTCLRTHLDALYATV
ncbi:unnamed protein product [Prunus armeniaca]